MSVTSTDAVRRAASVGPRTIYSKVTNLRAGVVCATRTRQIDKVAGGSELRQSL